MSLHNAINRKRTLQSRKRDFYTKEARASAYAGKSVSRWNRRYRRLFNRIERKAARRKLRLIAATFQHIAADHELLNFRQAPWRVPGNPMRRPAHWLAERAERNARIAAQRRVRRRRAA
jgi:hypothetical protein